MSYFSCRGEDGFGMHCTAGEFKRQQMAAVDGFGWVLTSTTFVLV